MRSASELALLAVAGPQPATAPGKDKIGKLGEAGRLVMGGNEPVGQRWVSGS